MCYHFAVISKVLNFQHVKVHDGKLKEICFTGPPYTHFGDIHALSKGSKAVALSLCVGDKHAGEMLPVEKPMQWFN